MKRTIKSERERLRGLDKARTQGRWTATECMDVWVECRGKGLAKCGDVHWIGDPDVVQRESKMKSNGAFITSAPDMMRLIEAQAAMIEGVKEAFIMLSKVELGHHIPGSGNSMPYYTSWDDGEYIIKKTLAALSDEREI